MIKMSVPDNIIIGDFSYMVTVPEIIDYPPHERKLYIGKFCSIAKNLRVYLHGNHRSDWITTYPFGHIHTHIFRSFDGKGHPKSNGDVIIGNDVWISENVCIMSGVKIGDGAIIANQSHVVKDVEPYTIVGGNPAKLIRNRFPADQIRRLLELRWWDWDPEKIERHLHLLCSDKISEFIDQADAT